jgi:putative antirepressor
MENLSLIKITENERGEPTVSGRELYKFLEVTERYSNWFNRMLQYGFVENVDYLGCKVFNTQARQELQEHILKISMAKEIAMLQRNEKGKQIRQYFIEVEKRYNDPMYQMARSLQYANNIIEQNKIEISKLELKNKEQKEIITEQKPKVEYYDKVTSSKKAISMSEVAKLLKFKSKTNKRPVGRNILFGILRGNSLLNKYNQPYQKYVNAGYFEVKQSYNNYTGEPVYTTLVTSKGIEYIIKLLRKLGFGEYEMQ